MPLAACATSPCTGAVTAPTCRTRAVYGDVVEDVCRELTDRRDAALAAGIAPDRLVLDPGLGFAKLPEHNWTLTAYLDRIVALGHPVLLCRVPQGIPRPGRAARGGAGRVP
ncbi:MAG: dihydropteroate synthase [Dermatophilaceae bacterium]